MSALFAPSDAFDAPLSYQRQEDEVGGRRQVTRGDDGTAGSTASTSSARSSSSPRPRRRAGRARSRGGPRLRDADFQHVALRPHRHGISDNSGVYAQAGSILLGSSPRPIAQAERFYDEPSPRNCGWSRKRRHAWTTCRPVLHGPGPDLGQNSYLRRLQALLGCLYCGLRNAVIDDQDFLFRRNQKY